MGRATLRARESPPYTAQDLVDITDQRTMEKSLSVDPQTVHMEERAEKAQQIRHERVHGKDHPNPHMNQDDSTDLQRGSKSRKDRRKGFGSIAHGGPHTKLG